MRIVLIVVAVLVVVIAAGLWWLAGDPNRFKPMIAERIEAQTGLHVDLRGDLAWRLWPPVQLVANDVVLDWTPAPDEPLAHIDQLQLDADLWPLLSRTPRLVVTGLLINGLHANLVQEGERANWMPPDHDGPPLPPVPVPIAAAPPAQQDGAPPREDAWVVEDVRLHNAHIRYTVDGELTEYEIDRARITGIAPEQAMPISAALRIVSEDSVVTADVSGTGRFDAAMEQFQFSGMRAHGTMLPLDLPYDVRFAATASLPDDRADVTDGQLRLADADATFGATITALTTEQRRIDGRFDLPQQRPANLFRILELEGIDSLAAAGQMRMTAQSLELTDLALRFDDSAATGSATVYFAEPFALPERAEFDLRADRFVVPQTAPAPPVAVGAGFGAGALLMAAVTATADPADEPLLPLEMLRGFDWTGTAAIGELVYDDATFRDARVNTRNRGGLISNEVTVGSFFDGAFETAVEIDARAEQPQWRVRPVLREVNSQALMAWLDQNLQWASLLLAQGELTLAGNTQRELFQTMRGRTEFDGGRGRLGIGEVKQQALAIAALTNTVERVQRWPDVLDYQRLNGTWQVDGMQHDIVFVLDNLRLNIGGTYDPFAETMDMRVALTFMEDAPVHSLEIHPALTGLALPVRCRGALESPTCRPDQDAVRTMVAQVLREEATDQIRSRVDDAIDRIPEEYRAPARDLLRGLTNPRREQQPQGPQPPPQQ